MDNRNPELTESAKRITKLMRDHVPHCSHLNPDDAVGVLIIACVVGNKGRQGFSLSQGSLSGEELIVSFQLLLTQLGELAAQVEQATGIDVLAEAYELGPAQSKPENLGAGITTNKSVIKG